MPQTAAYRRILTRMGYYEYQRGLIYHHLNEQESWKEHMDNCRRFIIRTLDQYNPAAVTILGSGWLLDIPVKEMSERVGKIHLIDIVHPPEVRAQVADMKNVFLREEDVTGGLIAETWNRARGRMFLRKLRSLDRLQIKEYAPAFDPGLVVSMNILTQLETLPVKFLIPRSKVNEKDFTEFRRKIQQKHLSFLLKQKSVLISDISELITRRSGKTEETTSVLISLPEGRYSESWTWQFDDLSSDYYNRRSVFKVRAIIL